MPVAAAVRRHDKSASGTGLRGRTRFLQLEHILIEIAPTIGQLHMASIDLRPPRLRPYEYRDRMDVFPAKEGRRGVPPLDREYALTSSGRKAIALILEECRL